MGRFVGRWRTTDPYNVLNMRNTANTADDDYNCAGFALRTYSWYCPNEWFLFERLEDYYNYGYSAEEIAEKMTEDMVEAMLRDFPETLRVVSKHESLAANEELIAFRLALNYDYYDFDSAYADADFHYRVFRDGRWQEKNGSGYVHYCEEPFADEVWDAGWIVYNCPLIFFAHKIS